MHYVLSCAAGRAIVGGPSVEEPWCEGRLLDFPPAAPLIFTLDPDDAAAPQSIYDGIVSLWSEPLMQAMRAAGVDNLQAHPAVLEDPRRRLPPAGFWAVNVIGVVAAVDLEASDLSADATERGALEPWHFVLDEARAAPFRIFRLAESPDLILVDEGVRRAIERSGLTDVILTRPGPADPD